MTVQSRCPDPSHIQMFAEGTLSGDGLPLIRGHVADCRRCRQAVSDYKQMMWDLSRGAAHDLPPALDASYDALMQAWRDEHRPPVAARQGARFVPSWAGYSVQWTRALPGYDQTASLLARAGRAVWASVRRPLSDRKGGGSD